MSQDETFKIKVWGARGSYPAPGAGTSRYGGHTACVEVRVGQYTLILDAGTGIIPLGKDLLKRSLEQGKPVETVLLFSHLHHDHTQGFPFFAPAFAPTSRIHIFGPDFLNSSPEIALTRIMESPYFPIPLTDLNSQLSFRVIRESDMVLAGNGAGGVVSMRAVDAAAYADPDLIRVRILRSYAHPGGVLHFRIDFRGRSMVYATDTEGYVHCDQRLVRFSRGADLLIHDAQYTDDHYIGQVPGSMTTQGFGHSTVSMACQVAAASGVKRLVLFHHSPDYADERLDQIGVHAKKIFRNAVVAHDGMQIDLHDDVDQLIRYEQCLSHSNQPATAH